jgi:hypothetical protein
MCGIFYYKGKGCHCLEHLLPTLPNIILVNIKNDLKR